MGLREGSRRLAIFVGTVGALAGCSLSGFVIYHHIRASRFDSLATSPAITEACRELHEQIPDKTQNMYLPYNYGAYERISVGKEGIGQVAFEKIINVNFDPTRSCLVNAIVTDDGVELKRSEGDSFRERASLMLALETVPPVLGFLIPWGTIRAVGWMLLGFVGHQSRSKDETEDYS